MAMNELLNQCLDLQLHLLKDNTMYQDFILNDQKISYPGQVQIAHVSDASEDSVQNLQQNQWSKSLENRKTSSMGW